VLHHAADHHRAGAVGDRVDVDLDRVVEELSTRSGRDLAAVPRPR
jgi:hypothetical protein